MKNCPILCPILYAIKRFQIKTKMRYHNLPIRMTKIHNTMKANTGADTQQ